MGHNIIIWFDLLFLLFTEHKKCNYVIVFVITFLRWSPVHRALGVFVGFITVIRNFTSCLVPVDIYENKS